MPTTQALANFRAAEHASAVSLRHRQSRITGEAVPRNMAKVQLTFSTGEAVARGLSGRLIALPATVAVVRVGAKNDEQAVAHVGSQMVLIVGFGTGRLHFLGWRGLSYAV